MTPVIQQGTVDGLRVLRSDGIAGRHAAALTFRVGRFDEPLAASGITHMVEHLAFAGRPTARYPFNASVGGRYTSFYMESADSADIADFVGAVCAGLTADAGAALDRERVVLRTEAASRGGTGALGSALTERYGAVGPGIVSYLEFGLRHLGWADVAAWRRRWFTSGNAVLTIAGGVPDGLRVALPDGPAARTADPAPRSVALPGFVTTGRGGIGLSLVRQRAAIDSYAAVQVLHERLTRVLRHELGLTYDVQSAAEELGPELAHSWIAADALSEQAPMAAHALLTEFEMLAADGCTAAEIAECARRMREAYQGPGAPWAVLQRSARDVLNGRRSRDPAKSAGLVAALEPKHVAHAAAALLDQMIVTVPWALPTVRGRMPALPTWSRTAVSGTVLASADADATLTVGPDGVTLTAEPGRHQPAHQVTVRYGELAALVRWNDGRHVLIGADGFTVQLDPDEWPQGERVISDVAAHVPAHQVAAIDAAGAQRPGRGVKSTGGGATGSGATGSGATAQLGGTAAPPGATAEAARRRRRKRLAVVWGARAACVAIMLGGLAAGPSGTLIALTGLIALLSLEFSYARAARQARQSAGRQGGR